MALSVKRAGVQTPRTLPLLVVPLSIYRNHDLNQTGSVQPEIKPMKPFIHTLNSWFVLLSFTAPASQVILCNLTKFTPIELTTLFWNERIISIGAGSK